MNAIQGKQVVVTRARHQAEELARPLRELGAQVVLLPTIEIVPPSDTGPLQEAVAGIDDYDWIIFGSANAVSSLASCISDITRPRARIAAIGDATRSAVEQLGWQVDVVPERFVAESLVEAMPEHQLRGSRILLPSAAVTRGAIPQALSERGATVDVVETYRNTVPAELPAQAHELFGSNSFRDWVTFASSSAVSNLVACVGPEALRCARLASIGPITSATIRGYGLTVLAEPAEHTVPALVESMRQSAY
jgi:uroporphyrinogen-III synthase